MKLFAARAEIDADESSCSTASRLTTVDEGLDLSNRHTRGRPIPAKVRFLLTEIVTRSAVTHIERGLHVIAVHSAGGTTTTALPIPLADASSKHTLPCELGAV